MTSVSPDRIRQTLQALAASRAEGASFCPSEAARSLAPDEWRPLMPAIRSVAAELAAAGELVATQRGGPVDPTTARGPIRLRKA